MNIRTGTKLSTKRGPGYVHDIHLEPGPNGLKCLIEVRYEPGPHFTIPPTIYTLEQFNGEFKHNITPQTT